MRLRRCSCPRCCAHCPLPTFLAGHVALYPAGPDAGRPAIPNSVAAFPQERLKSESEEQRKIVLMGHAVFPIR